MKIGLAIFFVLIASCTQRNDKPTNQSAATDTIRTPSKFEFLIRPSQIGSLKTGEPIAVSLQKLNSFKVVRDSIAECEDCDTYSPLYLVADETDNSICSPLSPVGIP